MTLTMIDLFSGIGGMSLAGRWAGFETVLFCEKDEFRRRVLAKHWPEVPIAPDIWTLTGDVIRSHGIERVDLLAGGFPCQAFSGLWRGGGLADERNLWPQMLRVIRECRPRWILGENVRRFVDTGADAVCTDLDAAGYEVADPLVFPALALGYDHERYRTFVIAHAREQLVSGSGNDLPGALGATAGGSSGAGEAAILRAAPCGDTAAGGDWQTQSRPLGIRDGLPRGLDRHRIAALGDAVIPGVVYPILAAIADTVRAASGRGGVGEEMTK